MSESLSEVCVCVCVCVCLCQSVCVCVHLQINAETVNEAHLHDSEETVRSLIQTIKHISNYL